MSSPFTTIDPNTRNPYLIRREAQRISTASLCAPGARAPPPLGRATLTVEQQALDPGTVRQIHHLGNGRMTPPRLDFVLFVTVGAIGDHAVPHQAGERGLREGPTGK